MDLGKRDVIFSTGVVVDKIEQMTSTTMSSTSKSSIFVNSTLMMFSADDGKIDKEKQIVKKERRKIRK